jgi:hypothetical protein
MNPIKYLRRRAASDHLRSLGLPVASATLAKLAVLGGGPSIQYFGRIPLYPVEELDRWVAEKLSPPRRSTSCTGERP